MQGNFDMVTALAARHDAFQKRLECIGGYQTQIIPLIGERTAMGIAVDVVEKMGDTTL
jgi:hypothetical protein